MRLKIKGSLSLYHPQLLPVTSPSHSHSSPSLSLSSSFLSASYRVDIETFVYNDQGADKFAPIKGNAGGSRIMRRHRLC